MNWKINILIAICVMFFSCNSKEKKSTIPQQVDKVIEERGTYFNTKHIIEANELKIIIGTPNVKVVHFSRPAKYKEGHIAGSVNIWRTDIEATSYPYKGMMSTKEQLETLFSRLGINTDDTLIIYDAVASCDAARLWWVLDNYGFKNVRILNGGIDAWVNEAGKLTTNETIVETTNFVLPKEYAGSLYITKEEMLHEVSGNSTSVILDTRTTDEFTGKRQKKGAKSGGRIPGSRLMDWANCMNYNGDKKFKEYTKLAAMYESIISDKDQLVISYCHSGVRSAHTAFVLTELLGYKNVKNYDGSWTEWSHFEDYPKEKDSITTLL